MDLIRKYRALLWVLLLLNVVVLLGQIWPAGAPPFARPVNIGFLVLSLVVLVVRIRERP